MGLDVPALRLTGVGVTRGRQSILHDVDWTVGHAERWVVLGPNGAGKTTSSGVTAGLPHALPDPWVRQRTWRELGKAATASAEVGPGVHRPVGWRSCE